MQNLKEIKELAIEAAVEAGKYALSARFKEVEISCKGAFNNLVTNVDKECEKIIVDKIIQTFPSHSILAEESGENVSFHEIKWVIDPIDGTTNYAHGVPIFSTSIGVLIEGKVIVGVVYDPSRDELFSASCNDGAYLNKKQISVSKAKEVKETLIATGFPYDLKKKKKNLEYFAKMLDKAQAVRRPGAASIDLCYVACGRFDGFWEFDLSPWDTAAGELLVREAGGKVTDFDNNPFDIYNKSIVATNGKIHDTFIEELTG